VDSTSLDGVSLIRPDGTEVDQSDTDVEVSVVGDSVIYRLQDPESGQWEYEIQNTGTDTSEFSASVTGSAGTTLRASTAGETYYQGDEVDLTAILAGQDGGIDGANANAEVTKPDGTTATVSLGEDDGVYTASLSVDQTGEYTASVSVEKGSLSRNKEVSWNVDSTAPISFSQSQSNITQRSSGEFSLTVSPSGGANETVVLGIPVLSPGTSQPSATNGHRSRTIPSSRVDIDPQTVTLNGTSETVNVTVTVPGYAKPGKNSGAVRAYREDGSVVAGQITFGVDPLFSDSLTDDFAGSPTSTRELEDDLFEDLSGDGDGTNTSETVKVFGELLRDNSGFNGNLTKEQARSLDWNPFSPEDRVQAKDMVTLFGKQLRAD